MALDIGRRVKVRLFHRDFKTPGSELVWATVFGRNEFQIDGPWRVDGYSCEDIVSGVYEGTARTGDERNIPIYKCTAIVTKGPFHTLRAVFESPPPASLWAALKAMHVEFENVDKKTVSLWFLKDVDAQRVARRLREAGAAVHFADVSD